MSTMTEKQKANLEAWKAALRSGNYAQGKSTLCSIWGKEGEEEKKRYCCLGVLMEVLIEGGETDMEVRIAPVSDTEKRVLYQDSCAYPPKDVMREHLGVDSHYLPAPVTPKMEQWLESQGIDRAEVLRLRHRGRVSVVDLNDDLRLSFSQIADFLDTFWESIHKDRERDGDK